MSYVYKDILNCIMLTVSSFLLFKIVPPTLVNIFSEF